MEGSGEAAVGEAAMEVHSAAANMRGWPLALARVVWLALAVLIVGIFAAAVPLRLSQLEATCVAARCAGPQMPVRLGGLAPFAFTPALYAGTLVTLDAGSAFVWLAVAAVLFWRRSSDPFALFCAFTLLLFGGARFPDTPLALSATHPGWWLPVAVLRYTGSACLSLFCYVFPDGRFVPRWTLLAALAWIAAQVPEFFLPQSVANANQLPPVLQFAAFGGFVGSVALAQGYRYWRVSRPAQRQQTKWVVLGVSVALVCYLALAFALPLLVPSLAASSLLARAGVSAASILAMLLVPVTLGIAMLRYRLFDIDRLINRALVYGALTALLAVIYFGSIIGAQAVIQRATGAAALPPVVVVASTLLIAALFTPLRHRLQIVIDRRFYRRKYDAARTLDQFSATLRQELDLSELSEQLVAVVRRTMRPEHVSLWLAPPKPPAPDNSGDGGGAAR